MNHRIGKALEKPIKGLNYLFINQWTLKDLQTTLQEGALYTQIHNRQYCVVIISEGQREFFASITQRNELYPHKSGVIEQPLFREGKTRENPLTKESTNT